MIYVILNLIGILISLTILIYLAFLIVIPKTIPKKIPASMESEIKKLKRKRLTDLQFVKEAYELINKRYVSETRGVLKNPFNIFENGVFEIWYNKKYQPCSNQNYILKIFLIKSRRFTEEDIKSKIDTKYIIWPHQFLKIKIRKKWYEVDLWGADHKIPFGQHFCLMHKK